MHIAHSSGKQLTVEQVAKGAGIKRRQVAYLADRGEIPGVRRSADGYHFEYRDGPALRLWFKRKRRAARERSLELPKPVRWYDARADVDMELPRKQSAIFTGWKLWMRENQPFYGWEEEKLRALERELATFNEAYETVKQILRQRSNQRLREKKQNL